MGLMGLDVGTTGTKAILFRPDGQIVGSAYREYPLIYPRPGWVELDSGLVWKSIKEAIREAASLCEEPVKALAVSSQGEGFTAIGRDGSALSPAIVSFDSRATRIVEDWKEKIPSLEIFRITGMPLSHIYTLNKIIWLKQNRPQIFNATWKFLCFEDFPIFKMGLEPTIDYSLAARTMAFNISEKRWSSKMLELAGVDEGLLSEVRPSGFVVGELDTVHAEELGLPKEVKVVTGGHDQPAGALGAGIVGPGIAIDATGTVECLTPVIEEPVLNETMLQNGFACYPHTARDMYVTIAFNFTGGLLLRWFRDNFAEKERELAAREGTSPYELILKDMPQEPTNIFVLPHFSSTGTPHFDPDPTGAIIGLNLATTRNEFIKALLEGLSFEMKLNIQLLAEAGIEIDELRATGGGAKSEAWLRLKADVFNKPVVKLNVSEAACLGMAILAGVAVGEYNNAAEGVEAVVKKERVFEPDPKRAEIYQEKFAYYRQLYPTLKALKENFLRPTEAAPMGREDKK